MSGCCHGLPMRYLALPGVVPIWLMKDWQASITVVQLSKPTGSRTMAMPVHQQPLSTGAFGPTNL